MQAAQTFLAEDNNAPSPTNGDKIDKPLKLRAFVP